MKKGTFDNICTSMVSLLGEKDLLPFQSESVQQWQTGERAKLRQILGLNKFTVTEARLKIKSVTEKEDYRIFDLSMNTEPGVSMPFFLLAPPGIEIMSQIDSLENYPTVIIPHGHGSDGRYGAAGLCRHRDMRDQQNRFNHDLGVQFVRKGYIAICPDARGAGDRRNAEDQGEEIEKLKSSSCTNLNNALMMFGTSLAAAWCWDLMALVDLIIGKHWGDPRRIGVCGFSGGGAQALLLGALDKRIAIAGVSGFFYKYRDSLLSSNLCSCNFIPGFYEHYTMASLCSLIAPRPLIVERGTEDPLNGVRGIQGPQELAAEVESLYGTMNCGDEFVFSLFHGEHRFSGDDIFSFFDGHINSSH